MKVLIVGAGAVGLVYARHLQLGGAEVSLFVREKYAAEAREGFLLYPLNAKKGTTARLEGCEVLTTNAEVAAREWDQVWLCVSSTAIRAGWLDDFVAGLGPETILVGLQPGLDGKAFLAERFPAERLVMGMIGLISYQAPLPGHEEPEQGPGVVYWLPPLSPSPFSGPKEHAKQVVAGLRAGGCPAKVVEDATVSGALGSAVLMPHLVVLEEAGWSLSGLRKGGTLAKASAASQEAIEIVRRDAEIKKPCMRLAIRPITLKLILSLGPWVVPLPLEDYLKYHFTKVGDQTRFMMGRYLERGRELEAPVEAIAELVSVLEALDARVEPA